jgi:hypothetical protein
MRLIVLFLAISFTTTAQAADSRSSEKIEAHYLATLCDMVKDQSPVSSWPDRGSKSEGAAASVRGGDYPYLARLWLAAHCDPVAQDHRIWQILRVASAPDSAQEEPRPKPGPNPDDVPF